MNFVGIKLKEGTPLSQTVDEGIILQLSNFALAGPADGVTQVVIESEGDSYVIANLSWPGHAQFSSDIAFSDQDVKISVKGKGEVHVTGTFSIDSMMDDSDEMGDSDLMAEYPSGSSDSEGEGYPAHVGSKRVELLDEDGGSDSSDSSAEKAIQAAAAKAAQGKPQQGKPQQQQQQQGKPQQQQGKPQQQQGKPQQQQGGKPANKPQQQQQQQQNKPAAAPAAAANAFQQAGGKKKKRKNKGGAGGEGGEKKQKQ